MNLISFNSTMFFTISSLFYSILLMIAFFTKKKIKNKVNDIFSYLIIINFVEIVLESILCILAGKSEIYPVIYVIANKLYLLSLLTWLFMFVHYIFTVSYYEKNKNKYNKYSIIQRIGYIISLIIIFILPIEFYRQDGFVLYSQGLSVSFLYLMSFILIVAMIICLLKNNKEIITKKYVPLYAFLIVGTISTFVQNMFPFLLVTTSMETFVTMLMFLTIENPDFKLIEEIKDAKMVSDNSNEEKSIFLYNITRDIKQLVNNIDYKIDDINGSIKDDELKDKLRDIKEDTNSFSLMVNEILDISSVDSVSLKTYNDKYNCKLLVKEMNTLYKDKCKNKDIDFRVNVDTNIPEFLYGDCLNLKKVLKIIFDNSLKNTKEGFIEFNINSIIKNDICRLIINIEDSGIGMRADKIKKVLNKVDNNIDDDTLTSARKIINIIGGTLIVSSDINKGTKVTIVIDQKIALSEDNKKITVYEEALKNKKILFVNDNEVGIKIIEKILNKEKIVYDIVKSGKECLDKIRNQEKYDLIFLEEEMPYLDGYQVAKKLNEISNFNIPVILLTRNNNMQYEDISSFGFDDYVIKPLNENKILDIINKYLK